MTTIILFALLGITILFLLSAVLQISKLQNQLIDIDKEQHIQNEEMIHLMKANMQHGEMLLQHIEILKYLVEQDPKLNAGKMYFTGTVGEA